ncbi:MAG: sodium:proton antiporter, partial [Planctomycetes bacterium]|nr:sodium:proton antiporter [Planctomycetota bacterium]
MSTLPNLVLTASMSSEGSLGANLPLWTVVPFALLLLAIAVFPLFAAHWWEHNANKAKVVAICALPIAAYMVFAHGAEGGHNLLEKGEEYVSFLALLAALFVISGGIFVRGSLSGTPLVNSA